MKHNILLLLLLLPFVAFNAMAEDALLFNPVYTDLSVDIESDDPLVGGALAKPPVVYDAPKAIENGYYKSMQQALIEPGAVYDTRYVMQYKLEGDAEFSTAIPTAEDAGIYTVYYRIVRDNHADNNGGLIVPPTPITAVINRASFETEIIIKEWNYGHYSHWVNAPYPGNNPSGGEVSFVYYTDEACTIPTSAADGALEVGQVPFNVGTYYIKMTVAETKNFNSATAVKQIQIKGVQFEPIVSIEDWTYGEQPSIPTVSNNESDGAVSYMYYSDVEGNYPIQVNASSDAGIYYIKAVIAATEHYAAQSSGIIPFRIRKAPVLVTAPMARELTYNGEPQTLVKDAVVIVGTAEYSTDQISWSMDIPSATDRGEYTVYYRVAGSNKNYEFVNDATPVAVTISPKHIAVVADAKSKLYGEVDPVFTYSADALFGSDALSGALSRVAGEAEGEYAITLGSLSAGDNYVLDFTSAKLTIGAKVITIPAADASTFIYDGTEKTYAIASSDAYTITGNKQTEVGTHTVTVSLKDKENTKWSDGTTTDKTYPFVISLAIEPGVIAVPAADPTVFVYDGTEQTYAIVANDAYTITGNKQTEVGSYVVTVSLKDKENTKWSDGTTTDKTYPFVIISKELAEVTLIAIPAADPTVFVYDGTEQTYDIVANDAYTITGNKQTEVGSYVVTVSLKDKEKTKWSDGTTTDKTYQFVISQNVVVEDGVVAVPAADASVFVYNGTEQIYSIAFSTAYTISGNRQTNAGTYTVTVSLNDKESVKWSDGTTEDKTYTFVIAKRVIERPMPDLNRYTYDGSVHTYMVAESDDYVVSFNTRVAAGIQYVIISLSDIENMVWSVDESVEDLTYAFSVDRKIVAVPAVDETVFVYDGTEKTYYIEPNEHYTIEYNKQTEVGTYSVIVSLKDQDNYIWSNGQIKVQKYDFVINPRIIEIPSADETVFMYTGAEQTYTIAESADYEVYGNKETNIGTYTVEVSLVDPTNTAWSDLTTADKRYKFEIGKKVIAVPAADETVYTYNGAEQSYGIAANDAYTITNGSMLKAGSYTVIVDLKDKNNTIWDDETTEKKYYTFVINKKVVQRPAEDPTIFGYNGEMQTYYVEPSEDYTISNNVKKPKGTYKVTISLTDNKNMIWDDGTYLPLQYPFVIGNRKVYFPAPDETIFIYNGKAQTYTLAPSEDYSIFDNVQTEIGEHTVTVSLNNPSSTMWEDGTTSPKTYPFIIRSNAVAVPVPNSAIVYTYNGAEQTFDIPESVDYTITGNKQTNAGTYTVTVSLVGNSILWDDNTIADKTFTFVINKQIVEIPAADPTTFVYDGEIKTYNIAPGADYTVAGTQQTAAGSYTVSATLNDEENMMWSDESTEAKSYPFVIAKRVISIPSADPTVFVYDGEIKTYNIATGADYTIAGTQQTAPGSYVVYATLKDEVNTMWSDETSESKSYPFIIAKRTIEVPTEDETVFIYNGAAQTYNVATSADYIVEGATQITSGQYGVEITLVDPINTMWSTSSSEPLIYPFVINKVMVNAPAADKTIFMYDGESHTYAIAPNDLYTISGNVQSAAGPHKVIVSLVDEVNYVWDDNTSADREYDFVIAQSLVAIPSADETIFVYNGSEQTYTIAESADYIVTGNKQVAAGDHIVTVSLADPLRAAWSDGTAADKIFTFTIAKRKVIAPAADESTFVYNAQPQTYTLAASADYIVTDNVQTNAGAYSVSVSLSDAVNTIWSDDTQEAKSYSFVIMPLMVDAPVANEGIFTFNGMPQTYDVTESEFYTVAGNVQTNAGSYDVIVSLSDATNITWSDGTIEDKHLTFEIGKKSITAPVASESTLIYDGTAQSYEIESSSDYSIAANVQTNAGSYSAVVSLSDKENTAWADGTTDDKTYLFTIGKKQITIPEADDRAFVFSGEAQTYEVAENADYAVSGNVQTLVGSYDVTVSLKDIVNTEWVDGTQADKIYDFVITEGNIEIPAASDEVYVFDGTQQMYAIRHSALYTVKGDVQTNAGSYEVVVSLIDQDNLKWADGTTEDKVYSFVIEKQTLVAPDADASTFVYNGQEQIYDVSESENYIVSGNKQTAIGTYDVMIRLSDADNFKWKDTESDVITYRFEIVKPTILDFSQNMGLGTVVDNEAIFDLQTDGSFDDVSFEIDGNITVDAEVVDDRYVVTIPETVAPGKHDITVTIICGDDTIKNTTTLVVNYSKDYIVRLWSDVVAVDNKSCQFTKYQWYKDGEKIDGATGQYYKDPNGISGTYYCVVDGDLVVGPKSYLAKVDVSMRCVGADGELAIFVYSLPINSNMTVEVYNAQGQVVASCAAASSINLPLASGVYAVSLKEGSEVKKHEKVIVK